MTTITTIRASLPTLPTGLVWRVTDDDGSVTVSLWAREGATVDCDEWAAIEQAVDLTPMGLAMADSGPEAGPFIDRGVTYDGGTYQRWTR